MVDNRLVFVGGQETFNGPFKNTILWVSETESGTLESTLPVALRDSCSVPLNDTCKEVPQNLDILENVGLNPIGISIVYCATKSWTFQLSCLSEDLKK